jgi:hypothetical protein
MMHQKAKYPHQKAKYPSLAHGQEAKIIDQKGDKEDAATTLSLPLHRQSGLTEAQANKEDTRQNGSCASK